MFLRGGRRLFLSGAPRFSHRGKVIAFQLKKDGAVRVAQSLQGEQVGHPRWRVRPVSPQGLQAAGGGTPAVGEDGEGAREGP